jgi:hypothetical protein
MSGQNSKVEEAIMNRQDSVSAFLLERYRIGEVTSKERKRVERALAEDSELLVSLAGLIHADSDFRQRFPREFFFPNSGNTLQFRPRRLRAAPLAWGLCAAALILVTALPIVVMRKLARTEIAEYGDRVKGAADAELSVYLKKGQGNSAEVVRLPDQADVRPGDTVQLAYRVQPDTSGERYGVIFSIDGRSIVSMHYPYAFGQSTRLVSGRAVPLDFAYTLDDAPDYEIFFFVVGEKPLNLQNVLIKAEQLALRLAVNPQEALREGLFAFRDYELKTLTLWKE